ncbi:hypothetical protein BGW38_009303 [Lunasporangiospora selenospora]|uniref:E3 ubiquitin-protein ligase n=1 Tax=Lunasporangiospora selenospora TaxID=979761 RepID=A0A9P6KFD2_9FUNG|nr:hypothetical protein BGW38_009303 [Lunasporangiospora selenospora]
MGRILRQGRDPTRKDLTQDPQSTQLAQNILAAWFQTVEWYGAENSRSRKSQETRQTWNYYNAGLPKESLGVPASSNHAGRMDSILENTLRDLTIIDVEEGRRSTDRGISGLAGTTRSNSASRTTWVNELLTRTRQKTMVRSHRLRSTRLPNGLSLHAKIQAYLAHYETTCAPPPIPEEPQPIFDHSKMAQMREEITKERFLAFGAQAYNTVMNLQLERHPLPVSWHTLAMIHQAAQSKGLEEIERRAGLLSSLPRVLRDFRLKCLETAASIPGAGVGAISTTGIGNEGSETEIEVMMVPRGGLYWEYYAANSSALQTHHLSTLDECWHQHLKSRLVQSSAHASRVAPTGISSTSRGASSATLSVTSPIKTYSEFLLAVDQVRRSYLETCIPSPEAFSVLENLDEMQQAEAAIFKQSLTASSPTLPSATIANPGSAMPQGSSGAASGTKPAISGTDSLRKGDASQSDTGQGNASTGDIIPSTQRPAPVALEQQIAEILKSKRGDPSTGNSSEQPNATKQSDGERAQASTASATPSGSSKAATKEAENKAVVQFGWTLHLLHANTQQYAWIWSWLYSHEGSSGQNVGNKMYTASKWIILPAKDLVRSRKEWKVSYGDRVWMVSYWFSTRNAKMELPEYLPRARGYPCRHIIPYGETYVICKTCPADILCMRCFRASDHTDHTMYLQCSWGTSICVCGDHQKLKSDNALHCSLHSAESQRSYSRLALGKPCQVKFKAGEMVYQCKTCVTDGSEVAFLCVRCFRSQNHFGHETVASISEEGASCSCHDGKSWKSTVRCMYHNVPQPLLIKPPEILTPPSFRPSHRCGHIFTPGEDIYHCRDCSVNKFVVLCSRCFHGSSCMNHNWKMGVFQKTDSTEQRFLTGGSSDNDITGSQASPKIQEITEDAEDSQEPKQEPYDASVVATCDCGDATLFKNAFDCNYHLPEEFRPVPHLVHCNYLFSREDPMFRCKTCHQFEHGNEDVWICERCFDTEEHQGHDIERVHGKRVAMNVCHEGLYCHCGDPSVTKSSHSAALTPHDASTGRAASSSSPTATGTIECKDDHNRQNQLCAKEIKEGERYYSCKVNL